jgi:ribonucleoside-diphosphate reductase alpha chain
MTELKYEDVLSFFNGDDMASSVFMKKYSYNKKELPQHVWKRLTKEFARIEKKYTVKSDDFEKLSSYGKLRYSVPLSLDHKNWEEHLDQFLNNFKLIISGGSGIEGIGTDKNGSYSNCYKNTDPQDNINSIIGGSGTEIANIAKRRGGTSVDLSYLRPNGAAVHNATKQSTGILSWMRIYNAISREIGQEGRQSGTLISLYVEHPDILDFIKAKRDKTKLTNTNISVKFSKNFLDAVADDKDFLLRFPINLNVDSTIPDVFEYNVLTRYDISETEKGYVKRVKAKNIWNEYCISNHMCGDPGCLFWDFLLEHDGSSVYPELKPAGVNLCGELPLAELQSCILIATNLYNLVRNPFKHDGENPLSYFDFDLAYKVFYETVCIGDDYVDLELEQLDKILRKIEPSVCTSVTHKQYKLDCINNDRNIDEEYLTWLTVKQKLIQGRKLGCGFLGLGDMYAALYLPYGDKNITEKLMSIKLKAELDATIDLAIIRGTFGLYDTNKEYIGEYKRPANEWYNFLLTNYQPQVMKMIAYGRRNVTWSCIAPTGTLGVICQTTSGIEPLFSPYYKRRVKVFKDNEPYDVIDVDDQRFKENYVVHHKLIEWLRLGNFVYHKLEENFKEEDWQKVYECSPYYKQIANDLDIETRTLTQSIINKYICSSISSTVNLPNNATVEDMANVYNSAYRNGCKGITCYRDGSKGGVLIIGNKDDDDCKEFYERHIPKLPKELKGDFHKVKYKGETYIIIIGIHPKCDFPVEIFTFKPSFENIEEKIPFTKIKDHTGKRIKIKKGVYSFESEFIKIPDLGAYNSKEEKQLSINISLMMRQGTPKQYISETIKRFDGDIGSFAWVASKILTKYVKEDERKEEICPECGLKLINENGCKHCTCGFSACT